MILRSCWLVARAVVVVLAVGCGSDSGSENKDPCDPNPCKQSGKTQCEVVDEVAVCGCDDGLAPNGRGGCESIKDWSATVAGNAVSSSGATQYTAHVRVVDADDKPIEGAKRNVGKRAIKTDVEGRAPFSELEAGTLSSMKITADGYVPALRQLSIGNAGTRELVVELVKQAESRSIDSGVNTTLQAGVADIVLPKRAF